MEPFYVHRFVAFLNEPILAVLQALDLCPRRWRREEVSTSRGP